jgi:hypothetical protein
MNDYGTGLPNLHLQAVKLPQTHIVLWPRNRLGEHATIAELMAETVQLLDVHSNHHHPQFPCCGNDHPIRSVP